MILNSKLWMLRHVPMPDWFASRLQHGVLPEGGRTIRYRNDDGILFDLDIDEYIQKRIYLYQYYEPECVRAARRFMPVGGVVIDVGSNIGQYSLLAAKLLGRSGRVIAFEPNPDVLRLLRHHIEINDFDNIEVIPCAVSDVDGESLFYPSPLKGNTGMGSLIPGNAAPDSHEKINRLDPIRVETVRLDQVLESRNISRLSFVKVDVEGFELAVLRGLGSYLERRRIRALMVEIWPDKYRHDGYSANAIMDYMESFGYQALEADWRGRLHVVKGVSSREKNVFFVADNF